MPFSIHNAWRGAKAGMRIAHLAAQSARRSKDDFFKQRITGTDLIILTARKGIVQRKGATQSAWAKKRNVPG